MCYDYNWTLGISSNISKDELIKLLNEQDVARSFIKDLEEKMSHCNHNWYKHFNLLESYDIIVKLNLGPVLKQFIESKDIVRDIKGSSNCFEGLGKVYNDMSIMFSTFNDLLKEKISDGLEFAYWINVSTVTREEVEKFVSCDKLIEEINNKIFFRETYGPTDKDSILKMYDFLHDDRTKKEYIDEYYKEVDKDDMFDYNYNVSHFFDHVYYTDPCVKEFFGPDFLDY
jgi:hypothetical protein